METRRANITVASDRSNLSEALITHLSVAITSFLVTNPDYDPWLPSTQLWVDDELTDFGFAHVITTGPHISGVILMNSIVAEHGGDNTLEFVGISFDQTGSSTVWQEVISVKERAWIINPGHVLQELSKHLFGT